MESSAAWRELALALKFEEPDDVRRHLADLYPALGLDEATLDELARAQHGHLIRRLRALVDRHRTTCRVLRAEQRLARSMRAAELLGAMELSHPHRIALDVGMLKDLCAHPLAKFLGLSLNGAEPVLIEMRRLRSACRVLRRYSDLHAYLDRDALHLRWHFGRGGLDLRYQFGLARDEERRLFIVSVGRQPTCPRSENASPETEPRSKPTWLGEVLGELGLIP